MQLTEIVTARIDRKMKRRIDAEVKARRARGSGCDGADITREALIEFFERREAKAEVVKEAA